MLVALALVMTVLPARGQSGGSPEYRVKAKYLSTFPSFVEWPADAWGAGKTPFPSEVNQEHLKISSRMLTLARRVINVMEPAKS